MTTGTPPGISHRDFLDRTLVTAGEWARFADPKILGVLILLALGIKDLVDHGNRFIHPHEPASAQCDFIINASGHSCAGIVAPVAFGIAAVFAAMTVVFVTAGLFPRLTMRGLLPGDAETGPINSLLYFVEVARHGSQDAYRAAVKARSEAQLLDDIAGQVYEVSRVAADKHRAAQRAYVLVIVFLVFWVLARVAPATIA